MRSGRRAACAPGLPHKRKRVTNSGKHPTVSVVTPAYNAARYLGGTIESVLAQTYTDFEMLVVDDGSVDETFEVARSFAQRDSRIRLLRQPNGGTSAARNRAVVYARGRYLALLDGDDRWMPDYLEAQLEILETDRTIDVLSANMINQGGRWDGKPFHTGTNGPIRRITLLDLIEREDA